MMKLNVLAIMKMLTFFHIQSIDLIQTLLGKACYVF